MPTVDIFNAAQALHRTITAVGLAPDVADYKASINSIDLPYVYVTHGEAQWTWGAFADLQVSECTMIVHVLCSAANQGQLGQNMVNALALADSFEQLYQSRQMLDINGTVEQIHTPVFSGIGDIDGLSDQRYLGFVISVPYKRKELP